MSRCRLKKGNRAIKNQLEQIVIFSRTAALKVSRTGETMELSEAVDALQKFTGANLTTTLATVEASLKGVSNNTCASAIVSCGAQNDVLAAAGLIKRIAGEIHVVVHALGILLCLPHILKPGENVEYVSLGAGNTGKAFDLETNYRIAEFKFIRWQGGPEVIRQNALFKDFYFLAEHPSAKERYLYLLGSEHPLKFFNSHRSLASVLSRHVSLKEQFGKKFGQQCRTVRDYYQSRKDVVAIVDVSSWLPDLVAAGEKFPQPAE